MTPAITLFLGLTTTLAASLVLYVANLTYIARNGPYGITPSSVVPVITPMEAWRLGARTLPVAFAASVVLYVVLQLSAAASDW